MILKIVSLLCCMNANEQRVYTIHRYNIIKQAELVLYGNFIFDPGEGNKWWDFLYLKIEMSVLYDYGDEEKGRREGTYKVMLE